MTLQESLKLTRFRESFAPESKGFERFEATQELREKYNIAEPQTPIGKLLESASTSGEPLTLYKFPVSRFGAVNKNKRLYPRELWENVINKQQGTWKNFVGLADHPEADDDGEFKNSAIVWLDMKIDDKNKLIWAVGTFVGPYGRLAQEIVDKGGRIGFSSSGFGELQYDGQTVDPDSYILERVADIVLNPSQDVFGDSQNALNVEYDGNKPISEVVEQIKKMPEDATNLKDNTSQRVLKENRMADTITTGSASPGVSKLEEKKFRKDIQVFLEDASKIVDPQNRLQELTEILSYFSEGVAPDLKESVEGQITAEKEKLENLLKEAQKTHEAFGVSSSDELKAGVALLAEEVKVASAEARDWEAIAVALKEKNQTLRNELAAVKEAASKLPSAEDLQNAQKRVDFLETQRKRQFYAFNEEIQDLQKKLFAAETQKTIVEASVKDVNKKTESLTESISKNNALLAKAKAEILSIREQLANKDKQFNETNTSLKESQDKILILEGQVERLQASLKEAVSAKEAAVKEFETFKVRLEEENTPKIMPRYEERAKGFLNFNEGGIEAYWKDLVERHGNAILQYEQQIRGAKTIREASSLYMKYLPYIDEDAAAAEKARLSEAAHFSKQERKEMLEEAGMKFGAPKDILDRNSWAK